MEQHHHDTPDTHKEGTPSYIPVVFVAAILALFAWVLLHNYHQKGYIWDQGYINAPHEGAEGGSENTSGREEHEGVGSIQEPKHGGDMMTGSAATGRFDSLTGNYIYETGAVQKFNLKDSLNIEAGSNSSEAKLVQFLSGDMMVDTADKTKGWITLDRFYFQTGKAVITPASQAQLKNIAAILKAYPDASLKIGGYTDNAGNPQANTVLSSSRANAAKNALAGLGIAANRLSAEGYGQEHPVKDNNSPEGKAQNRRVDVRVTNK